MSEKIAFLNPCAAGDVVGPPREDAGSNPPPVYAARRRRGKISRQLCLMLPLDGGRNAGASLAQDLAELLAEDLAGLDAEELAHAADCTSHTIRNAQQRKNLLRLTTFSLLFGARRDLAAAWISLLDSRGLLSADVKAQLARISEPWRARAAGAQ